MKRINAVLIETDQVFVGIEVCSKIYMEMQIIKEIQSNLEEEQS